MGIATVILSSTFCARPYRRLAELDTAAANARGDPCALVRNVVRDRDEQRCKPLGFAVYKLGHLFHVEYCVGLRDYQLWHFQSFNHVPAVEAEPLAPLRAAVIPEPFPSCFVGPLVGQVVGKNGK